MKAKGLCSLEFRLLVFSLNSRIEEGDSFSCHFFSCAFGLVVTIITLETVGFTLNLRLPLQDFFVEFQRFLSDFVPCKFAQDSLSAVSSQPFPFFRIL